MSQRQHGSHGPYEISVGTLVTPREQPAIADTQGKLEPCDTNLIERSPGKVDLVERGEHKVYECFRSERDTFRYVPRFCFGRNINGRPRPYLVSAAWNFSSEFVGETVVEEDGLTGYGKCSVENGEDLLRSESTPVIILPEQGIGERKLALPS